MSTTRLVSPRCRVRMSLLTVLVALAVASVGQTQQPPAGPAPIGSAVHGTRPAAD
jgi:hypothetical protein